MNIVELNPLQNLTDEQLIEKSEQLIIDWEASPSSERFLLQSKLFNKEFARRTQLEIEQLK